MARRAHALSGLALLLLLAPCVESAAAAAQTAAPVARHAPKLEDLPRIEGHLREALAEVPAREVEAFVQAVVYEAGAPRPELADLRWPALFDELRQLTRERGLAPDVQAYLDLSQAFFVATTLGDHAAALQILGRALREGPAHGVWRAELALEAANLESELEGWVETREFLQQAEAALPDADPASDIDLRVHSAWAALWIDFALPELARPHVEAELARARSLGTPTARARARTDQLRLHNAEEDYDTLERSGAELLREEWWARAPVEEQVRAPLIMALGWLTREHDEVVPRGEAERRLEELRSAGQSAPGLLPWIVRHAATCAADGADWPRARELCAELARTLAVDRGPASARPAGRLGAALVALEARIELAASAGAPDRAERLRPHLERVRSSWKEFLAHWSEAPLRSGGLPYLFTAERHQLLQELVDLELAVEGEDAGTTRALAELLEAQMRTTLSRRLQPAAVTIEEVRRVLGGSHGGVLLFVPSRDRSFAFALDARGVRLFHLPPEYRLRRPCHALALAVQETVHSSRGLDDPELRAAARAVADDLLPEQLARWIDGWTTLRLIGLDDLGYVPFELLPAPGGRTRGEHQAISYCASLPLAVALERASAEPGSGGSRLVIAPDSEQPGLGLALGAADRESLRDQLPVPAVVCEGARADIHALAPGPDERIALLHVLAHGTHDPKRERPAGLRLAGGVVWAEDVEALPSPPLVLLTACEAGRAPLRRGDGGRSDLAAAFLVAGARCVVLPTCDLELDGTLRAAPLVLEHLSAGEHAAEALRATRAELAERDPVAALQAHLLHVVGGGATRLVARGGAARSPGGRSSALVPALLALGAGLLWFALRRRRGNDASGAVD